MNTAAILTTARELIADPKHWIKGILASTLDNCEVDPEQTEAVKFCMVGAVLRAEKDHNYVYRRSDAVENPFLFLTKACNGRVLAVYNDHYTHEQVLQLFDKAIELAKGLTND